MATYRVSSVLKTSKLNALLAAIDAGTGPGVIEFYSGTYPATVETAPAGTLLASFTLADPAGAVAGGVLTLTKPADVQGVAAGEITWGRITDSDGNAVCDGEARLDTDPDNGEMFVFDDLTVVVDGTVKFTAAPTLS